MPTISTHLFSIEAPDLFEKALWMGQLIRMERMDRAEGEGSFAEVNFFVGHVAAENLLFPADCPAGTVLDALWDQYQKEEEQLAPLAADALHEEERSDRSRVALVKLAATSWRPEVGQLVWIHLPKEAQDGWIFARFVLEFDWAHRATYEPLGRSILASIQWNQDEITAAAIDVQKVGVWSIFDAMDPAQRLAISRRYREVLGQVPHEPEDSPEEEIQVLDLRKLAPDDITVAALEAVMVRGGDAHEAHPVMLQTAFLPDLIEFSCHEDDDDDAHRFGEATVAIVRALQSLGPKDHDRAGELMWEHCKLCFDATDYGTGAESNEDYFGIHGPEEALAHAGKATMYLSESFPGELHDIFSLDFYPPWEDEHGFSLVIREGELAGWSDPGGWLGEFLPKEPSDDDPS